jgi:hypothetical protein
VQLLLSHRLLTAADVLGQSELDLMELLDLPHSRVTRLLADVSMHVAPGCLTAAQLLNVHHTQTYHVPTGLPVSSSRLYPWHGPVPPWHMRPGWAPHAGLSRAAALW